jgi:hypothetical protein
MARAVCFSAYVLRFGAAARADLIALGIHAKLELGVIDLGFLANGALMKKGRAGVRG